MSGELRITYIIVARDAAAHLPGALSDFLAQDYPKGLLQLVLVDGLSEDASPRLARGFKDAHPELDVAVLENPGRLLASGWNVALAAAKGDVIVRVDAHAEIPPDFVRRHVEAHRRGHAITGGPTVTTLPAGFWPRLLSVAENSPFGGGAAAFRRRTAEGYVDTLAHAAYAREIFAKVGGYDERLARTEDNEMHERMKRAGYRFWFDPEIRSGRKARPTLSGLLKQKFGNGRWIGLTMAVAPRAFGLRHFVPGAFLLGLLIAPVPVLAAYAVAAGAFALLAAARERPAYVLAAPLLAAVFLLMHLAYGFGTLAGLAAMPLFKWKTRTYVLPRPVAA